MTSDARHLRDRRRPTPRRGFGALVAILLLVIVAAMLPVIAGAFTANAKRTRTQADDAQLRQLLIAGAMFAKGQATAGAGGEIGAGATTQPTAVDIALPPGLADAAAKLTYSLARSDADHASATIRAQLGSRSMQQTLALERHPDGTWHATGAVLNRD